MFGQVAILISSDAMQCVEHLKILNINISLTKKGQLCQKFKDVT